MKKTIKKIGIVVKPRHAEARDFALDLCRYLLSEGQRIFLDRSNHELSRELKEMTDQPGKITWIAHDQLVSFCDFIIVLGGDGTLLSVARTMRKRSIPIFGVNMGTLGFLTEINKEEAFELLERLLAGKKMPIHERSLLEVSVLRNGKVRFKTPVFNDAVMTKGQISRITEILVYHRNQLISAINADGVIVCTPTGSTAYSLSAGGPILDPTLNALVITPICPHSLSQRPLVISDKTELRFRLGRKSSGVFLTLDGQDLVKLTPQDTVMIKLFRKHKLQLIYSPSRSFFDLLRVKFNYGYLGGYSGENSTGNLTGS